MHVHPPKPVHGWREFLNEVGIIVVGVLIALSAEQVVEWLHDRHNQHKTLERLFEESRLNVSDMRDRRPGPEVFANEERFATMLTRDGVCPPEPMWAAVGTIGFFPQTSLRTSVYEEVVGAGGLSAIASPAARNAVAVFHSRLGWVQAQTDFFRSVAVTPVANDDPRVRLTYNTDGPQHEQERYDRTALCNDPRFRNLMVSAVRNHVVWDGFRNRLARATIRMCAVLGRELGRECTPATGAPFTEAEKQVMATEE